MRKLVFLFCAVAAVLTGTAAGAPAADNTLTAREKQEGWILLFDGKTLNGWTTSARQPSRTPVDQGAINPHGSGGYMMIHEKKWGNYILAMDFKLSPNCNSGIFVRTFPLTPWNDGNVGYYGIEVALDAAEGTGYHHTGALYDLVRPSRNAMKPIGEWNHIEITCDRNLIAVAVNGETVTRMNLDEWTTPNKRPDGSDHKFGIAYKQHPRWGYIGLQDHGAPVWFKNIKIRPLPWAR